MRPNTLTFVMAQLALFYEGVCERESVYVSIVVDTTRGFHEGLARGVRGEGVSNELHAQQETIRDGG